MHRVLVTKKLNKSQRALAHEYSLDVDEIPFIKITYRYDAVTIPKAQAWIVTSSHAAKYIASHAEDLQESFPEVIYAIGESTASHIDHLPIKIKIPSYAMAHRLVELVQKEEVKSAVFFCGNLRMDTVPEGLKDIEFYEVQVYETELLHRPLDMSQYQAVAFFSPSGVKAFAQENTITSQAVVAIGSTTKRAVKEKVGVEARIPASASIEDVLFAIKQDIKSE